MANKPVLKVAKSGESITSSDIRDFAFHSDYAMFKIHDIYNSSITINAGQTTGYVDINHTLDYVPAYLIYIKVGSTWELFPTGSRSYITDGKIRITYILDDPYNLTTYSWDAPNDLYDDRFGARSYVFTGNYPNLSRNHAIKFDTVAIAQGATVYSATLDHYAEYRYVSDPAHNMELKTYGIDTDTCATFDSNPMGRDKTSAVTDQSQSVISTGESFGTDVKNQVQEILNRGGWSSGNHIGFIINDDSTPANNAILDEQGKEELEIIITGGGSISYDVRVVVFKDKISN